MGDQQTLIADPGPIFRTLLLDPPWNETGGQGGSWGESKRGADRHYPLLKTRQIPHVVRRSGLWRPAEHAHCWMWVTDNFLQDGLWVMRTLGFTYVRTMVWVKMGNPLEWVRGLVKILQGIDPLAVLHQAREAVARMAKELRLQMGLGQYLRGAHEICLFGVRGRGQHESVRTAVKNVPSVIFGRRTKHSKKPVSSYEAIEKVSKGPRVEFFARSERPGWTSWGNEV